MNGIRTQESILKDIKELNDVIDLDCRKRKELSKGINDMRKQVDYLEELARDNNQFELYPE